MWKKIKRNKIKLTVDFSKPKDYTIREPNILAS